MSAKPNSGCYTLNGIHAYVNGRNRPIMSATTPDLTGLADGTEWFNTTNGKSFIVYTDVDGKQWVAQTPG